MPEVTYDSRYPTLTVGVGWKRGPTREAGGRLTSEGVPFEEDPVLPDTGTLAHFEPARVWARPYLEPDWQRVYDVKPVRHWEMVDGGSLTTSDERLINLLNRVAGTTAAPGEELWRRPANAAKMEPPKPS